MADEKKLPAPDAPADLVPSAVEERPAAASAPAPTPIAAPADEVVDQVAELIESVRQDEDEDEKAPHEVVADHLEAARKQTEDEAEVEGGSLTIHTVQEWAAENNVSARDLKILLARFHAQGLRHHVRCSKEGLEFALHEALNGRI